LKTRDAVLEYQYTAKDTETKTKDLDLTEPISAIEIEVECTNGATSNLNNFISDIVTKVEVVDGSDVLASLNMSQLEALHFYKTGKMPCIFPSEWAGGIQRHNATLFFGRHLWDREYALDPKKFTNPQLKVTFNKAVIRAANGTGFASGDNIKLSLIAKVFADLPAPAQFLMQKQIESFTGAASGEKRVELPRDYIYRMLLTRFWLEGYDINELISDIKLTCDTDKFIPFNRKTQQLDAYALSLFGLGQIKHDILRGHTVASPYVRLIFNKEPWVTLQMQAPGQPHFFVPYAQWSSRLEFEFYNSAGAIDSTARKITAIEQGHAPHATLPITFGRLNEKDDWFDPKVWGKLELVLTQATIAGAVCEVVAEQVRPQ